MRTTMVTAALVTTLFATSLCIGQDQGSKSTIEQQLESQYVPTKASRGNTEITTPGSVLVIQRRDLIGEPTSVRFGAIPNYYKDGRVKHGVLGSLVTPGEGNSRSFQVGEKVYLLKLEVKDNSIVFNLLSAEAFDGVRYKASVQFQFPKGYLASADVGKIRQTIGELFTIEAGGDAGDAQPQQKETKLAPIAAPPPPPEQQQQPQSIELGQTPEQVVAILGPPEKVVKLPNKEIYVYKNLKVTFRDRKVSDVE
jgi:hypothetical protein